MYLDESVRQSGWWAIEGSFGNRGSRTMMNPSSSHSGSRTSDGTGWQCEQITAPTGTDSAMSLEVRFFSVQHDVWCAIGGPYTGCTIT